MPQFTPRFTAGRTRHLSTEHEPLFGCTGGAHLGFLILTKSNRAPRAALTSVVERLIGTIRREFLTFAFWNRRDLERKLAGSVYYTQRAITGRWAHRRYRRERIA